MDIKSDKRGHGLLHPVEDNRRQGSPPSSRFSQQKQVLGLRPGIQHRFADQRKDAGVRDIQIPLRNREPRRHSRQHIIFQFNCCDSYQTPGGS